MQTLRKRNSPCKYKNEPARFFGEGMIFKAKLIGILEVNEARGDKMCQDALNDLKTAIRAAGEHKQRITISIAIDGLRLRDEKTLECMYHHPVHKISFIAQDMSDSRAFGYIFGSPDTGHRFFGIKTDKTAGQVVIAMRDLFQVVFELKKKEIEMTKRHIELEQNRIRSNNASDSTDEPENNKIKVKTIEHKLPATLLTREPSTSSSTKETAAVARNSEAIADLLDLEDELNSIQQGISQMDRITPSDPFGPISAKGESFLDSFKEKTERSSALSRRSASQGSTKETETEKSAPLFGSAASTSSRAIFFSEHPTTDVKSKDDAHWFDQETDSLFTDATSHPLETSTSPVTFHTPTGEPESTMDERRSPLKTDLFTDLDPLGTGKIRPYLDKKDFFQELKKPPKKVLKELITEPTKGDGFHYFATSFDRKKEQYSSETFEPSVINDPLTSTSPSINDSKDTSKYSRIDPFEDMDPFEKTDPFLEDSFPKSIGFPSLTSAKADIMHEKPKNRTKTPEEKLSESPSKSIFSSSIHGPLRVSLPPEKPDTNTTISLSSFASRFRSSPSPTEESKTFRRRHYQALKHSHEDKSDDQSNSPILEEVYMRGSPKPFNTSSFDKKSFIGSPPPTRSDKIKTKMSTSLELLDSTPDPPPRPKAALFAIKPPPLPPKKQNQPTFRPPARPPSLEESVHYDYLRQKAEKNETENVSPKEKISKIKSQNSVENFSNFPILPRPPQRKTSVDASRSQSVTTPTLAKLPTPEKREPSVLNITLNQLDQSGLENLASSLGIPTENVCNMTLQELTKMLAQKYLGTTEIKTAESGGSEFHADFEANFPMSESGFDKYAVFKELISEEEKTNVEERANSETEKLEEDNKTVEEETEDKYAALRQLSLCAQKSDNLSEDLDVSNEDDSSARADNISDIVKQPSDEVFLPLHSTETVSESPVARIEPLDDVKQIIVEEKTPVWNEAKEQEIDVQATDETNSNIPDEFQKNDNDNWATFEGVSDKQVTVKSAEIENSPISSDGKDDAKVSNKPTTWQRKPRTDFPWKDEDESCDDYSAKESFWSDESSHDGQSPVKENLPYHRKTWNRHTKPGKDRTAWPDPHWRRRWMDDTEDEYDEFRRRRKPGAFEWDRKKDGPPPWGRGSWETERYSRGYPDRRKAEYRRRCDSDASDKEYTDGTKPRQYYPREALEKHWSDNRESRSKYKRAGGHKRPSSASDAKRYEKMYDHDPRSPDKRESEEEDYLPRFRPSRKDMRYHSNIEHYGSYDRRAQASHQRRMQRGKRSNKDDEPISQAASRHFFPETPRSDDTPEPTTTKELHFKFEDDFIPSPVEHPPPPPRKVVESPGDRRQDDWGRRIPRKATSPATDNNNDHFASFNEDFEISPKLPKDKAKPEVGGIFKKPSLKGRSHLLGRQDSSASLRKSESINIFSRESDPFEDDDFFSSGNNGDGKFSRFFAEKSKSNTNVSDPFTWKEMFSECHFED